MRIYFFFSSRRRHTRLQGDWSSDVCSSDLGGAAGLLHAGEFVDLLVSDPPEAEGVAPPAAHLLAEAVPVLAVTPPPAGADSFAIVVAVDAATALQLAAESG